MCEHKFYYHIHATVTVVNDDKNEVWGDEIILQAVTANSPLLAFIVYAKRYLQYWILNAETNKLFFSR